LCFITSAAEDTRQIFDRLLLPLAELGWVHSVGGGDFIELFLAAQGVEDGFGFDCGAVDFASHWTS
jgi:hypothetical protein